MREIFRPAGAAQPAGVFLRCRHPGGRALGLLRRLGRTCGGGRDRRLLSAVSTHHPWRKAWRNLVEASGRQCRDLEDYHISAFLGAPRRCRDLVDAWCELTGLHRRQHPEIDTGFHCGDRMTEPFHTDQDLLAAALMAADVPVCALGPEGFGFTGFAPVMLHPTGPKPWSASYLRDALRGRRPDLYNGAFWRHLDLPIAVLSPWRRHLGKSTCHAGDGNHPAVSQSVTAGDCSDDRISTP